MCTCEGPCKCRRSMHKAIDVPYVSKWITFFPKASEEVITLRVEQVKELRRTLMGGLPVYTIYLFTEDSQGNTYHDLTKETYVLLKNQLEEA